MFNVIFRNKPVSIHYSQDSNLAVAHSVECSHLIVCREEFMGLVLLLPYLDEVATPLLCMTLYKAQVTRCG